MRRQTRDRLILPALVPVALLVLIAFVLYGFSRILLSLSHNAATATALVVAMSIVLGAAVVAGRTFVRASSLAGLVGVVAGVAMLAGGIALVSIGTEGEGAGGGEVATVQLVAANLAFSPTSLTVPAGAPFNIVLDNQDPGIQHNVQIFAAEDFSGAPLFDGELVTGPAKATYEVSALDVGTYYFRCVVHPTMIGTIQVVEAGGGGGGGGGPTVTVTAQGIQFDTDTIELPADTASTIAFDNKDAGVQHNISIYADDTATEVLFKGELVTGAAQATYEVPPLPAGEYYFRCDVHPNMNGTVVVGAGGGQGSAQSPTGPATPTPSPAESASGGGTAAEVTTMVTAEGLAFDTTEIVLPAGQETQLHFVNNDAGVQHNIVIATDSSLSQELFAGELLTGASETDYVIPPLDPGTYYFACVVHPTMNGTVTVG